MMTLTNKDLRNRARRLDDNDGSPRTDWEALAHELGGEQVCIVATEDRWREYRSDLVFGLPTREAAAAVASYAEFWGARGTVEEWPAGGWIAKIL